MGKLTARTEECAAQMSYILSEGGFMQDRAALRLARWLEIGMPVTRRLHGNELENLVDNSLLLTKAKLGVHRQRQDFGCGFF